MKKIEHQHFLKINALDKALLLQPIQEKIEIFDRMYKLLDLVTDCEKGHLLDQLEALDLEILEDIDEEYADKLEFNEFTEIVEDKPELKPIKAINKMPVPSEEKIIDELVKMGRTKGIKRSTFQGLGVKTPLNWKTIIGKYRVTRTSVFRFHYQISLN